MVDLIHYLRAELEPDQLSRFAVLYLGLTHNPCLTISTHILSAKMAYNSVEVIVTKSASSKHTAAKVLLAMLEISTAKLESMLTVHQDILGRAEKTKNGEATGSDMIAIEKSRPYAVALFASEKTENILPGKMQRAHDHITELTWIFRVQNAVPYIGSWVPDLPEWTAKTGGPHPRRWTHQPDVRGGSAWPLVF